MHGDNKILRDPCRNFGDAIRDDAQLPPNCRVETAWQAACGTSFAFKHVRQHLPRNKINKIEGFMRTARSVVDKYRSAASRWFALAARMLLPAGLFAMSIFGAVPHTAHAQTIDPATKLAPDLLSETDVQAYSATGDGIVFGE
jgi:hypothetical protein